ncbi:MAG: AI-2E family transporter [Clostridiales bacterium]|nr:AI-2E family transporter [Clostridiales bacterium]
MLQKKDVSKYLGAALTVLGVVVASVILIFCFVKFDAIKAGAAQLVDILMPFIVGLVIAYLLSPIYNALVRNLEPWLRTVCRMKRPRGLAKGLALFLSVLLVLAVVFGLIAMILPQLFDSVANLGTSLPGYLEQTGIWLDEMLAHLGLDISVQEYFDDMGSQFSTWLAETLLPGLQSLVEQLGTDSLVGGLFSGVVTVVNGVTNFVLGLIVSVYLLADKERMLALSKKLLYAIAGTERGNRVLEELRKTNRIFGGFITGKLVDSLIMGILCFIGSSLLRLPYALLVSVVVGVTNIIPFFGPFLGAIPCALLILLTDPIKCVYFIIFILALQQFDGNILGPRILGNTTGVSPFGVLFAIIFFGGVFGFVGTIIGVPLFAILSSLVGELVDRWLKKKNLSRKLGDYANLDYVKEDAGQTPENYIKRQDPTRK